MAFRFVPTAYTGSQNTNTSPQIWRPPASDLMTGELAVNLGDGNLFLQPSSGAPVQFSTLDATGRIPAVQMPLSGVTAGTYTKLTVDATGRVTTGGSLTSSDLSGVLGYQQVKSVNGIGADTNGNINVSTTASSTIGATITGIGSAPTQIDSGSFISAKYLIEVLSASNGREICEITVIQDGGSGVFLSQYGVVYTSPAQVSLVTLAATCVSGFVTLTAAATLSTITLTFTRTYFLN